MKYIDSEKLIAEIERRMPGLYPTVGFEMTPIGVSMQLAREELKHLLFFVKSLQREQPEADLEKEFSIWWKKNRATDYNVDILYERYSAISQKLANHFFELGRLNAKKEETR